MALAPPDRSGPAPVQAERLCVAPAAARRAAFRDSLAAARQPAASEKGLKPLSPATAVVQRRVVYENGKYAGNGDRPAWRAEVKKKTEAEARAIIGKLTGKIDMQDENLDRGHAFPFEKIEGIIVDYLNSPNAKGEKELDTMISTVIGRCTPDYQKKANSTAKLAKAYGKSGKGGGAPLLTWANKLLSILNSAPANVRTGSSYLNRSASSNADPITRPTPQKKHARFDDHSKTMLANYPKLPLATSPGLTTIITSDGPVKIATLTPVSKARAVKAPKVAAASQSADVKAALNPGGFNPHGLPL